MKRIGFVVVLSMMLLLVAFAPVPAQNAAISASSITTQPLIKFSGTLGAQGVTGVTFSLYADQAGGAPLWVETQNVAVDGSGHYTVYLGANHAQGVPPELFATGEARWLGVQAAGQAEQPRILLAAVPYAMKALDANTLGGVPASSYVSSQGNPADYRALVQTIVEQMKDSGALAPFTATAGATNFTDTTTNQVVNVTQLGTGKGISATTPSGQTIYASNTATTGTVYAVYATAASPAAIPIRGVATSATGSTRGLQGNSASTSGVAGYFEATATSGTTYGVQAVTDSPSGYGVYGIGPVNGMKSVANNTTGVTTAFIGTVNSPSGIAAIFNNNAGGPLASFRNNGVQEIGFDASGDVTAAGVVTGKTLVSTVATGTAPLTVVSTTLVSNLNASLLGGVAASGFLPIGGGALTGNLTGTTAAFSASTTPPTYVLAASQTNPGITTTTPPPSSEVPVAIVGVSDGTTGYTVGVSGVGTGAYGIGVSASANGSGPALSVVNNSTGTESPGLTAVNYGGGTASGGDSWTVYSEAMTTSGYGGAYRGVVHSPNSTALNLVSDSSSASMIEAQLSTGSSVFRVDGAGNVSVAGNLAVTGNLSAGTCGGGECPFDIDHPLDPANKYLNHASVESSELKNIYDGMVTLDGNGEAVVQLPDWFEALNGDFRYQLTPMGAAFTPYVAEEITNGQFKIVGMPGKKVSWQVTGVRHDPYAKAHPLVVEQDKKETERGLYVHPELYGAPKEQGIAYRMGPKAMPATVAGPKADMH
jgi:hypothetical protein